MFCLCCNTILKGRDQKRFCSTSCAAKINNLGRDKKPKGHNCPICNKALKSINLKHCSRTCAAESKARIRRRFPDLDRKLSDRVICREAWQRYKAKKVLQTPLNVDIKILQEIYLNCPEGYEVDHKIPISKGGLHHPDNLQYLLKSENRKKSNKLMA